MGAEVAGVIAIVAVAAVHTAALVVAAGTHTLRELLDVLAGCGRSVQVAMLAIVVATAQDSGFGTVLAAVGAFVHTVPAALLAVAGTTGELEEAGRIVAEAVARAVQAAQNELEPGAVAAAAAVKFGRVREVVVEAVVDGLEGTEAAAVHMVAASVVEIHHSG